MHTLFQRTRSLRTYLLLGLGTLGLGFVLVSVGLRNYIHAELMEEVDAQARSLVRYRAQQELLQILMEEEVDLRSFLGSGETPFLDAYSRGARLEEEALRTLEIHLPENYLARGREAVKQLRYLIERWHEQAAVPRIRERLRGELRDLREARATESRYFSEIKGAITRLTRNLDARDDERFQDIESTLAQARWIGYLAEAVLFLAALLLSRWILRNVASPLADLAEEARAGDGYSEPGGQPVREVAILGRALYDLDLQSRDREKVLRREHDEALATRAFEELVQFQSREEDLLQALDQALARHLQTASLRILLSAETGEALVPALPPMTAEAAAAWPMLADANLCRALHRGTVVGLDAAAATACLCPLGVPAGGSYLCLPMMASGRVLGLVNLQARQPGHWNPERRRMAEALVSASAGALQSIRALKVAQERAIRDGLTGVYNRRFLDEFLPKTVDQAARNGFPLSVLMLDIDHFKAFNDEFGHEGGDVVLRLFAQNLQAHVRAGDVVARYGGEEFAILLPHAGPDLALALAERLRVTIQDLPLPTGDFPPGRHITMSTGLASFPDHARSPEAMLSLADEALYAAKGQGRNCVVSAAAPGQGHPARLRD